jgi:hypothetical protein
MTSLDELDNLWPPPDPTVMEREPRRCRRHEWEDRWQGLPDNPVLVKGCRRCPAIRDEARAKRGKSSRRLGHDGERRSEKRYGWRKVGEFGGITDLEGTLAIVQQKTSRREPPKAWMSIFRALEARSGGRIPLVLLSFVHAGIDTEDLIVIRGRDWIQLHGKDEPGGDPARYWPVDFERGE